MTMEEKVSRLTGIPAYLPDDLAERLGATLSGEDVQGLCNAIGNEKKESLQRFCARVLERRTQKERLAMVEAEVNLGVTP